MSDGAKTPRVGAARGDRWPCLPVAVCRHSQPLRTARPWLGPHGPGGEGLAGIGCNPLVLRHASQAIAQWIA
jgi:hypothetical protein